MGLPTVDLKRALLLKSQGYHPRKIMEMLPCSPSWYAKNVSAVSCDPTLVEGEIVKNIEGYGGKYAVTNHGRVWSYKSATWLRQTEAGQGYWTVTLCHNGSFKDYVHRIVATAFLENPDNKRTVNHIDGVKINNHLYNLEWATHKEQIDHAIETGLNSLVGEDNGFAKLDEAKVIAIREKYYSGKYTHKDLASEYGVTRACILKVVRGRSWKHLPFNNDIANTDNWGVALNRNSKLTMELANEIRARYLLGGCTTRSLGKEYDISPTVILGVIHKRSWVDKRADVQAANDSEAFLSA